MGGGGAATGGGIGALIGGAVAHTMFPGGGFLIGGALGALAGTAAEGMLEPPETPDAPKPEPVVEAGDEGIRTGTIDRTKRRRQIAAGMMTRGQERGTGASLANMAQTLG